MPNVQTFSATPVVIRTSVYGHLRLFGSEVLEAIPASPNKVVLVADSGAARACVVTGRRVASKSICKLRNIAVWFFCERFHRHPSDVQQPTPIGMRRMLHAGGVELSNWNERPARHVAVDVEERVHEFRRLQIVNVAVLQ